jgi:two-component system, chemotaxis family, CheB/CheR fusion protein
MTKSKRRRAPADRKPQPSPTPNQIRHRDPSALTIVGVGASAGGLEAFTELLQAMPPNPGLALVLVQHLAPNHDSALPVLLAPHTRMPIVQVSDGERVKPDHVYVIPPNAQMELNDGTLTLSPRPHDRSGYTPIDTFFTSLARRAEGRPIAVVLSGTASDGSVGIRDVKSAGGITFAQTPESANYDGMPKAALATGMVDVVKTPAEIGAELAQIAAHPYVRNAAPADRDDLAVSDEQLKTIFELLRPISGVDFRHYKMPTIRRRLLRRMALQRLTDVDQYVRVLQANPGEVRGLFRDLLIHVTRFFREPDSFVALAEHVFPKLIEGRSIEQPIRAWVCGCATGEEAYSLAILLVESLQKHQSDLRVQIFATDVSETAIEHARAGVYAAGIAADVGPERLRRFFTRSDGHYRVSKVIRDMCVFARQDLTKDPPFSRLDIVMCRNVLIYMDTLLQKRLINVFHYALNPNGYLVLGQAETVGGHASLFGLVDKKHRIHQKKSAPGALGGVSFPVDYMSTALPRRRPQNDASTGDKGLQAEVSRLILDRYAPAGVVVDSDLQIVQFRGQTGAYLEPAPGDASLSLLKMAREGLLYGLRTALHTVRKTKAPVRKDGLQVRVGNAWQKVVIEVIPLVAMGRPHFLVLFDDGAERRSELPAAPQPAARKKTAGRGSRAGSDEEKILLLQRELAASREYLQSIIQELEAANEELQSANEEILSSNEELQSTNEELDTAKEELQSTNEELNTVNEELHGRNEELSRVNSDLMNLVGSVQIAIVIVGSDLRIRRFTPMAERVLNLIPGDLDRSIGHIKPNIDCPDLEKLIVECMDSVAPIEKQVRDRDGHWYSLRIRPYKSLENKIDGAVLALVDIDGLKRSEERVEQQVQFLDTVLQASDHPMAILSNDLKVRHANESLATLFAVPAPEIMGRRLDELGGAAWKLEPWRNAVLKVGTALPRIVISPDGARRPHGELHVHGHVASSPDSESTVVLVSIRPRGAPDSTSQ